MFQSLVITLREGVEAALIVGIVLGYLRKTGHARLSRLVFAGLLAAVVASVGVAYVLHRLRITELRDAYEGWLMLVGAAFGGGRLFRSAPTAAATVRAVIGGKRIAVVVPAHDEEQLLPVTLATVPDFVDRTAIPPADRPYCALYPEVSILNSATASTGTE